VAWAEKLPGGKGYRGRYRDATGKARSLGRSFTRKRDAEAAAFEEEERQRRPGAVDPREGAMSWDSWRRQWWERRRVADSTKVRDLSRLEHHLVPQWGSHALHSITRDAVEAWVVELTHRPDLSAGTVQRIYHLFSASMRAAVHAGKLQASPCVAIELERPALPDERFLTRGEVDAIAFHLNEPYKTLVVLAANTGLRWGELVALHWQRVHLDETSRRVDVQIAWDTKNRAYKTPKDHERRSVPLPDWLAVRLAELADRFPPESTCGVEHPNRLRSPCTSSLVLAGRAGVPIDYDSFRRSHWMPACRKAKVTGATPHSLRHTYASWLLQSRLVTIEALSKLMGHADIKTTQRYGHLADSQWDSVRGALALPAPEGSAPPAPHDELAVRRQK